MKVAHGKYCGDFPKPKKPFVATPFFGKYAKTGVKDNKVDPSSYQKDPSGAQDLETGKDDNGGDNGSTKYPNDQYQAPPQAEPETTVPPAAATPDPAAAAPPAGTGTPATGAPTGTGGGTGAPPP